VIDVKPNGILVLEARKTIQKNEEHQSIVLSGQCRTEDVTNANSVLSSQLAELTLISKQEGQVKDAATKGWIPRIIEALFAF
jgi:flagellar L-ring protein precursor FlgH